MNKLIGFAKLFTNEKIDEISHATKFGRKYVLCTNEILEARQEIAKATGSEPAAAGLHLADIANGRFKPSPNLLEILMKHNPRKVTVSKKGETMFLYSNSLLSESIVGTIPDTGSVIVVNDKDEPLGYGTIKLDRNGLKIVTNDFNLSDFLKREKIKKNKK